MSANLSAILYLVSGVLFILALRGLSSPETSRQGNLFGIIGMALAVGVDSEPEKGKERPGELERSSLDSSLAKSVIGWEPQTNLREGVENTLEWFRSKRETGY